MPSTNKTHQFTHANSERRASIVYGSVGKGGLFIPSDFIRKDDVLDDEDEEGPDASNFPGRQSESSPLLPVYNPVISRKGSIAKGLISEERELLKTNHIEVEGDEDAVAVAFEDAVKSHKINNTTALTELKSLTRSSVPLVLTFLLQNSLSTVSVFSVGHLGAAELAAVSMGAMIANITGYATIQGISTSLDTLCPQAFGAKKYHLVGAYLQKCLALITVVMTPVLILWLFFGFPLLRLIIPDEDTAKYAAIYLKYITPGIPAYILFECGKRFLQAQGVYHISTYVLFIAAPSNLVMNLWFVKLYGYIGAPIAVAINYWLMTLGLYVCTVYLVKAEDTPANLHPLVCWAGLDVKAAFRSWGKLIQLAIPGLIMLEAEFLAFEILTLMASYLGTIELAAQSIGSTLASLTYQVPFAIGIASSTRIANFLGAGLGNAAKRSTQVSLAFGFLISLLNCAFVLVFRNAIPRLFTNDRDVIETVDAVIFLLALMQISDANNANSAGCLRGQGQTKIGGIVNLVSYYVIGIPMAIYLSFYSPWKGSLHGLWIGTTVALTIIGVVQSYYALFADFDHLVAEAEKRTQAGVSLSAH